MTTGVDVRILKVSDSERRLTEEAPAILASVMRFPSDPAARDRFLVAHRLEEALGGAGEAERVQMLRESREVREAVARYPDLVSPAGRGEYLGDPVPRGAWMAGGIVATWFMAHSRHAELDTRITTVLRAFRTHLKLVGNDVPEGPEASERYLWRQLRAFGPVAHFWAVLWGQLVCTKRTGLDIRAWPLDAVQDLITVAEQMRPSLEEFRILPAGSMWRAEDRFYFSTHWLECKTLPKALEDCLRQASSKKCPRVSKPLRRLQVSSFLKAGDDADALALTRFVMMHPQDDGACHAALEGLQWKHIATSDSAESLRKRMVEDLKLGTLLQAVLHASGPDLKSWGDEKARAEGRLAGLVLNYCIGLALGVGISPFSQVVESLSEYLREAVAADPEKHVPCSVSYIKRCWASYRPVAHLFAVETAADFYRLNQGEADIRLFCTLTQETVAHYLGIALMIYGWGECFGFLPKSEAWHVPWKLAEGRPDRPWGLESTQSLPETFLASIKRHGSEG